ncbi:hypothetical protein QCA50_004483 [Cerrena zonata]|uniref:NADP-dependent oxidoreductase domain-containing protein n=1 Tax=Cerrena zonata TaxID=2478898 RepID=A0AAW0GGX8_9APHY
MSVLEIPIRKLNTGASVPGIGIGCASNERTPEAFRATKPWILNAIQSGYRHLDTASLYGTEESVGLAVKESGVPREELFVTTKLPWSHTSIFWKSLYDSLDRLDIDYVDMYLMHSPMSWKYIGDGFELDKIFPRDSDGNALLLDHPNFSDTWATMEMALATGKVKAIGVSNFSIKNLEKLLETAKVVPAVNQVEMHPLLVEEELLQYCKSKGIVVVAYSPTGFSDVLTLPLIQKLAEKYSTSAVQLVLSWHIARGVIPVPQSTNPGRQLQNLTLPVLEAEDVKAISSLDQGKRLTQKIDEKDGKLWGAWTAEQLGW